jgi:hypothetical protein
LTIQGQAVDASGAEGTAVFLPPSIAFLAFHDIHLQTLWECGRVAARCGVPPEDVLLRSGMVDEAFFYQALARETRLPFCDGALAVHPLARFAESVMTGVLPLADEPGEVRFAIAPRGDLLERLLASRNRDMAGLAIVTPTRLRAALLAAKGEEIAAEAADGLARLHPHLAYRGGMTGAQQAWTAGLLAALVGLAFAPAAAWLAAMLCLGLVFLGCTTLRIAAALNTIPVEPACPPPRGDERDLPVYTVVVPLYREGRVLPRLIAVLSNLDYPACKLDVKLVVEADDAEMQAALARTTLPGCFEVRAAPPGEPRTKPRALSLALPLARGSLTVVYDAEDVPDRGQLRLAASLFSRSGPEVACLQARLAIDNTADSWLTRLFTLEYSMLFDVFNPGLSALGVPIPLGGTSNHFRGIR